ncbi:acyltransferase [Ramlibacter sp. USB13]|uniref:Acyltransferase n=1 Tax=Ramlibacter cellulosilyticus TaxID=2764187 RepID=A0A923SB74_9BURK|nr:acyltransferase [Ramlibacter cellulosilyticus]MBC5783565.1 acyltransferase [Ramlibacter cellulosilyticus]
MPSFLRGALALLLLVLNTLVWSLPVFAGALLKLALPFPAVRRRVDPVLNAFANGWVACNSGWMHLAQPTRWDVEGLAGLRAGAWYLVNCNHQSWVDIFVLQHVLRGRIPLLKFFLKQQLIYVPVIGLAWWALDFPFMKRHGKDKLRKRPELRSEDHAAALRACRKFSLVPTSVMNFAEGTRFTPRKREAQASPYRHLLKPRAGALALTLQAMGGQFRCMLDATIVYPGGVPTFWDFLCGRVPRVVVRVRQVPIPAEFTARDYAADPQFRRAFGRWLTALWEDKDREVEALLQGAGSRA